MGRYGLVAIGAGGLAIPTYQVVKEKAVALKLEGNNKEKDQKQSSAEKK